MTKHNWKNGDKVVWVNEKGEKFLGTITVNNWREATMNFSEYPAYGVLDGWAESKVVPLDEIEPQADEEEQLLQAQIIAHEGMKHVFEACERQGAPLAILQASLVKNALTHGLFNWLVRDGG